MTILLVLCSLFFQLSAVQSPFSLSGVIHDTTGRPVDAIRVSLLDENYQSIRTIFSVSGRYQFKELRSAIYYVKVDVVGTPYEEALSSRIEVQSGSLRGGGEEFIYDFTLRFKKTVNRDTITGTVFSQTIPEVARLEYERGAKSLQENDVAQAIAAFEKAVEWFPEYFSALEALGLEYVKRGDYDKALPLLTRALDVNHNAPRCWYALGVAHLKLKKQPEAIEALKTAADKDPANFHVFTTLGLAYGNNRAAEAEVAFKKAYELGRERAAEVHLYLAAIYNKQENFSAAVRELELFLKEAKDIKNRPQIEEMLDKMRAKERAKQ
ncbi:MAG: tetratricopeptide repeat protein [Acidobacteria bacterium]|nr:tetratricopeptide repeat protein [Acidobacteriota bacterium]